MANKKLERKLLFARIALNNSRSDAFISGKLERFGYDLERLNDGWGLFELADGLYQSHLDGKKEQAEAWDAFQSIFDEAHEGLVDFRRVARLALKGHEPLLNSLGLDQPLKEALGAWLEQARIFYTNALNNSEIIKKLARFSVGKKELKAGNTLIDQVEEASAFHKRKQAETQQAVKKRDQAFEALNLWMNDFWEICRIALADHPEQLGKLRLKK